VVDFGNHRVGSPDPRQSPSTTADFNYDIYHEKVPPAFGTTLTPEDFHLIEVILCNKRSTASPSGRSRDQIDDMVDEISLGTTTIMLSRLDLLGLSRGDIGMRGVAPRHPQRVFNCTELEKQAGPTFCEDRHRPLDRYMPSSIAHYQTEARATYLQPLRGRNTVFT
jgi:hypothetical protein